LKEAIKNKISLYLISSILAWIHPWWIFKPRL